MENELQRLDEWIGGMLAKVSPAERRKLGRKIGVDLRRGQSARIASQRNPDGSGYAPRKRQKRISSQKGRLKRQRAQMFQRLRMLRNMQIQADENQVSISFISRLSRIASVHQHGLKDRVSKHGPEAQYPA
ncbi:MAG: phage virion morphogenesis protein, partial [Oxalobacter sp.]|nr:phage virion morphogenesis protein [Oxalobacter sp.]